MEEAPLSVVRFCFSKLLDSPQNSEVPIEVPVSHKSPVRLWKPVEGEGVNLDNMNSLASGCVRFVRRGIRRPEEEGVTRMIMKGTIMENVKGKTIFDEILSDWWENPKAVAEQLDAVTNTIRAACGEMDQQRAEIEAYKMIVAAGLGQMIKNANAK